VKLTTHLQLLLKISDFGVSFNSHLAAVVRHKEKNVFPHSLFIRLRYFD
jgi:hypothetical protein